MSGRAEKLFIPPQTLSPAGAARFLRPFGAGVPEETETLLTYTWEGRYFRRIVRCRVGASDLVLKVRREEEVSLARLSSQCAFSEYLAENGIRTARFLSVCPSGEGAWKKEDFAAALPAEGGPVLVTLEYFCEGQLTAVTPELTEAAGRRPSGLRPAAFFLPRLIVGRAGQSDPALFLRRRAVIRRALL